MSPYKEVELKEEVTIEDFWEFVEKRHEIWRKRFVLREKPPWTDDSILQKYRFTNVYRELDYGTHWAIDNIIKPNDVATNHKQMLYWTIAYRCCNNPATFDSVGFPGLDEKASLFTSCVRVYGKHNPIFSPAYRASAFGSTPRLVIYRKILNASRKLIRKSDSLLNPSSLKDAHDIISSIWGIGPFIGFEICNDILYSKTLWNKFTENDFVHIGPGAVFGLQMLFGKLTKKQYEEKLVELWESQDEYLSKGFVRYNRKSISLSNTENCLCEARKYWSIKNGGGRPRIFSERK